MNDTEIVRLYFARSDSAIAETARKYGAYLDQTAYNILRDREDTEEVVSDSYLQAWNSIPPQKPRILRHFLSRITRNLALNRLEYLGAQKRSAEMTELMEELNCGPCTVGLSAESEFERRYLAQLINRFLAARDKSEKAAFVYRYYYCCTLRETAEKLGLPEHRLRYMLSKLRAELESYLEREGVRV